MEKALFLDRDGIINFDYGYVYKIKDCVFVPGIFSLVRKAKSLGYRIIIVTNQGGVGLGYYSILDFQRLMKWIRSKFTKRNGHIDKIYFEPTHPKGVIEGFIGDSERRKPNPGMLLEAKKDFDLKMEDSLIIGDKLTDMEAAKLAGVGTRFLYVPGSHQINIKNIDYKVVNTLDAVTKYLEDLS